MKNENCEYSETFIILQYAMRPVEGIFYLIIWQLITKTYVRACDLRILLRYSREQSLHLNVFALKREGI